MAVTRSGPVSKSQLNALALAANAKSRVAAFNGGTEFGFGTSGWLAELQRIRAAVIDALDAAILTGGIKYDFDYVRQRNCSGFHVVGTASYLVWDGNTIDPEYWYPGTVENEGAYVDSVFEVEPPALWNEDYADEPTTVASKIIIGEVGGTLTTVSCGTIRWTYAGTNPNSITHSADLDGTWTVTPIQGGAYIDFAVTSPQWVTAGTYWFNLSCADGYFWNRGHGGDGGISTACWRLSLTTSSSDTGSAIHSTTEVRRLRPWIWIDEAELPWGIWLPYFDGREDPPIDLGYSAPRRIRFDASIEGGIWLARTFPPPTINTYQGVAFQLPFFSSLTSPLERGTPDPSTATITKTTPSITYRPQRYPVRRDTGSDVENIQLNCPGSLAIVELLVRRQALENESHIYLPPSLKPELEVKLGFMRNEAFVALQSVTIAEDSDETRTYVYWPIFTSTPVAYQAADDAVSVLAICENPLEIGYGPGEGLKWPVCACQYNDTETLLGIVPDD